MNSMNRRMKMSCTLTRLTLMTLALGLGGCASTGAVAFQRPDLPLTVREPGLYPETIEYDAQHDGFLVSSFRRGAVYRVRDDGSVSVLVDDARLCSVLGIAVDVPRNRLWLVNSDLGACLRPSVAGPKNLAGVGSYDLSTGQNINYADLSALSAGPASAERHRRGRGGQRLHHRQLFTDHLSGGRGGKWQCVPAR